MTNEPASSPAPSMDSAAAPEAAGELTPETLNMLEEAISAILDKIGDNPKYEQLAEHLQMAQAEASQLDGGGDEDGEKADPYSFDEAQANMTARRAGA
jgi:hypothetical protein